MNRKVLAMTFGALALVSTAAIAKQYVDYMPEKGLWEINAISVDPNHVDEYLTGLRKSQTPGFEVMKAHGLIDSYKFLVRTGYMKDAPNVLIMTHFTSAAALEPNKARDEMIEKEIMAKFSEEQGKAAVAGYEKYRQFIDDGMWGEVTIAK